MNKPTREQERQWQEQLLPSVQVFVEFYDDKIIDIEASNKAGTRVMKNALLLKKKVKGDRFSIINKEANKQDIKQYPNEYNEYLRQKNEQEKTTSDTSGNSSARNASDTSGNSGRPEEITGSSGFSNQRKRGLERADQGQEARNASGTERVRERRSEVPRSPIGQVVNSQSSSGRPKEININFGTFSL